jgi:hypothetical protein
MLDRDCRRQPTSAGFYARAGADKSALEALALRLRGAGLRPFFDEWHLVPADLRIPALEAAIEGSPTIAVLIGPKGDGGVARPAEPARARARGRGAGKRVIPMLLPRASTQSLEGFLGLRTGIDFDAGDGFRLLVPNGPTRSQPSHRRWCHSTVHPIVRRIASAIPAAIMSFSLVPR